MQTPPIHCLIRHLLCLACLAATPALAQAPAHSRVGVNNFGDVHVLEQDGEAGITGDADYVANPGETQHGSASAGTLGFFSPTAPTGSLLSNLGQASVTARVQNTDGGNVGVRSGATARFLFEVVVLQTGPAPAGLAVPIDVSWRVFGETIGGIGGLGDAHVLVTVPNYAGGEVDEFVENGERSGITRLSVIGDDPFRNILQILLEVSADTGTGPTSSSFTHATADPTFEIPTDFAYADSFTLGYSANLPAVPEPSIAMLGAIGSMGFLFGRTARTKSAP